MAEQEVLRQQYRKKWRHGPTAEEILARDEEEEDEGGKVLNGGSLELSEKRDSVELACLEREEGGCENGSTGLDKER